MKRLLALLAALLLAALLLTACGEKTADTKTIDLAAVLTSFGLPEEGYLTLSKDDLMDMYGIASDDVTAFAAVIASSGVSADEIILIQSPDEAAAKRVKAALDLRYTAKLNETENYLPEAYALIQRCQVTSQGLYTALIVAPEAEAYTKLYNDALK